MRVVVEISFCAFPSGRDARGARRFDVTRSLRGAAAAAALLTDSDAD